MEFKFTESERVVFIGMLIVYSMFFGLIAAVACRTEWKKKYYTHVKTLNSAAFLGVFGVSAYVSGDILQFWLMLPAFLCCFAGDILMAQYNRCRKRVYFKMGLGIFLAGHICFARWLCVVQPLALVDFVMPVLAVLLAWYLVSLKNVHTGKLKPFIMLYACFVAMVFGKGLRLAICFPTVSNLMIAVGSALFFVSDISIVFLYFYKQKGVSVHLFNLATYYYGMFLLASNLLFL